MSAGGNGVFLMAGSEAPVGQRRNLATLFPPAWLVIQLALDAWTVSQSWRSAAMQDLPGDVANYVYGLLGGAAISLIWGLGVLALAWSRAPSFPRHFIVWQIAVILWTLMRQAWVFMIPDMVLTPASFLFPAGEIVISIVAIVLAARQSAPSTASIGSVPEASPFAKVLLILLGTLVGAVVGAVGGFLAGAGIATVTDMSCFEGACGFFAGAIGLAGLVVGAVAGGIVMIRRVSRPRRPA